jgi:hypothetical protein
LLKSFFGDIPVWLLGDQLTVTRGKSMSPFVLLSPFSIERDPC